MKNNDLLDLIGKVDDKFVAELYDDAQPGPECADTSGADKSNKGLWKRWASLAACAALVLVGGAAVFSHVNGSRPQVQPPAASAQVTAPADTATQVIIDVNPSLRLDVKADGSVEAVTPLNDDAKALIKGMDFKGLDCDECAAKLVKALESGGYLSQTKNSVLVSVVAPESDASESVKAMVVTAVNSAADSGGLELSILSQTVTDAGKYENVADKYGISVGKAALIKGIVTKMDYYDYSELAKLSIHSLNQIMEYTGFGAAARDGAVSGAITATVSSELGISRMTADDALDLALSMTDAYDRLCELNPAIDATTYTGYDLRLERGVAKDGSTTWTIIAENTRDNGLPSVSFTLGKGILSGDDVSAAGKAVMDDTLKLACDIFGLGKTAIGSISIK